MAGEVPLTLLVHGLALVSMAVAVEVWDLVEILSLLSIRPRLTLVLVLSVPMTCMQAMFLVLP